MEAKQRRKWKWKCNSDQRSKRVEENGRKWATDRNGSGDMLEVEHSDERNQDWLLTLVNMDII